MFSGLKFGGLGGGAAAPKPDDPASTIAHLLNRHAASWMQLEKEIKEVKARQQGAQAAYDAAVEGRELARAALVQAEGELAGLLGQATHDQAELEASQAANAKVAAEVETLKSEAAAIAKQADGARKEFSGKVAALMASLQQLQEAHPQAFFKTAPAATAQMEQ